MSSASSARPVPRIASPELSHRPSLGALWTVFSMTVARQLRAVRLLVLVGLYLLPIALVLLIRQFGYIKPAEAEEVLIFNLMFTVLVPLTALLYAPGIIQDEVEEQTLTYLMIRPVPRWAIYVCKLLATIVVTAAIAAVGVALTEAVIYWGEPDFRTMVAQRAPALAALFALALVAYNAIFGIVGLFVRKALAVGVIYIITFEGVLANIDFIFRKATVTYYARVLARRWMELPDLGWSINLDESPWASQCVLTLLAAAAVLTVIAAVSFTIREFRVKTPEAT